MFKLIVSAESAESCTEPCPINKLPRMLCKLVNCPTLILPPTPSPPVPAITSAPVVTLVLSVPLAATMLPEAIIVLELVKVVNLPVDAVDAPIGVLFTLPPVITALPDAKLVKVPVVPLKFTMPDNDPPVI